MTYLAKTPDGLLPCPHCGGEAEARDGSSTTPYIRCKSCGCRTGSSWDMGKLKAAWNRRAERTCQIVVSVDRSPASYGGRVHRCSSCRKALPGSLFRNGWIQLDYCPRCGARVTEVVRDGD